jgi:hypothetical protein
MKPIYTTEEERLGQRIQAHAILIKDDDVAGCPASWLGKQGSYENARMSRDSEEEWNRKQDEEGKTEEPVELHPVIGGIDPEHDASMNEGPGETKEQWMAKNNLGQGSQWMCKGCCIALGESFENYSGIRCMECGVIRDNQ